MKTIKLLAATLAVLSIQHHAIAGNTNIYKWKDKSGVIHYSQTAPQGQEVEVITTRTPRNAMAEDDTSTATTTTETGGTTEGGNKSTTIDNTAPLARKDQATCDVAQKAANDLQKPVIMNEGKIMTIEEKNIEIQKMQEIIKIHCP